VTNSLSRRVRTGLFYALRTAFRLTPMPQGTRDRLRQRFLDTRGHWVPEGPKGQAPTGDLPRRPYVRSDERAIGYVPYEKGELPDPLPATLVAFYLPQFHTIPENDEWWGKGFTEWRNVTRALPQFEGHYQPRLPGDLGFYDLRNVEVMHEQARLAREYGISAFCFYFYWFGGKTLLETPLRNWLNDKTIDLKFCLCWANEKWTRTWDGRGSEILIDQQHSPEDDIAFIEHVAEYMRDPRYLRIDGKPVLAIYRPGLFPDIEATSRRWREWCGTNGIPDIYLVYVQSFDAHKPSAIGFDAAIAFPPNRVFATSLAADQSLLNTDFSGEILDWRDIPRNLEACADSQFPYIPCVSPGWDNQPRRPGSGRSYIHASPRGYRDWLERAIHTATGAKSGTVFINAWNEWAEGALLEPDMRLGYAYLDATRQAMRRISSGFRTLCPPGAPISVVIHVWYVDVLEELLQQLAEAAIEWRVVFTTTPRLAPEVEAIAKHRLLSYRMVLNPNRGRDVLPFLVAANQLLDEGADFVLKLHTKRSLHRGDGDAWRRDLIRRLVSEGRAQQAASNFMNDPNLGMVAPEGHVKSIEKHIGANRETMEFLSRRIGMQTPGTKELFALGSMFWVRIEAIRPLLDANLLASEFEHEAGQLDGTLAHAIERHFMFCVKQQGYSVAQSSSVHPELPKGEPNKPDLDNA
jgi:lipopolysaccharide biosynthesis protein